VHLLNPRPTPPRTDFFLLVLFLVRFGRFSVRVVKKGKEDHVENLSQQIRQKFDVSFFQLLFIAFSIVCLSRFKNTTKHVLQKIVSEVKKNRPKKSKTDFLLICFYQVFGRFSVRGA
jgi:hypothetical protein